MRISPDTTPPIEVRIIGGSLRGRRLVYTGSGATRPMKDRTREALFSRIRYELPGMIAIDLFAGTGALLLEAVSRGARLGWGIEQNFGMCEQLGRHIDALGIGDRLTIVRGDAFVWGTRLDVPTDSPWLIFCSPPYELYASRQSAIQALLTANWKKAPEKSILVVESQEPYDPEQLIATGEHSQWHTFAYAPALLHFLRKG